MNNFHSIPPYANPNENTPFVTWSNIVSEDEVNKIIKMGESIPINIAGTVGHTNQEMRKSKTSWILLNDESKWLYNKLGSILRRVNGDFYRFDVTGMYESLQFTIYNSDSLDFYDWHQDHGVYNENSITRKLSMSILLTHPNSFEGGDLQIWGCNGQSTIPKEFGLVTVFPSYTLHRVTPVTKGTRKSLVVWYGGPAFR